MYSSNFCKVYCKLFNLPCDKSFFYNFHKSLHILIAFSRNLYKEWNLHLLFIHLWKLARRYMLYVCDSLWEIPPPWLVKNHGYHEIFNSKRCISDSNSSPNLAKWLVNYFFSFFLFLGSPQKMNEIREGSFIIYGSYKNLGGAVLKNLEWPTTRTLLKLGGEW